MTRFERVRLRNGLGWVSPASGEVRAPPDGESFAIADPLPAAELPLSFYVVDAKRPTAVVVDEAGDENGNGSGIGSEGESAIAQHLFAAGFPCVAWVVRSARGVAVARCRGDGIPRAAPGDDLPRAADVEAAVLEAACAIWAQKALGGWDESALMTLQITFVENKLGRVLLVRARGEHGPEGWTVDVDWARGRRWKGLIEDLAASWTWDERAALLIDVDAFRAYNGAQGRAEGDFLLARVQNRIELAAARANASFWRVGDDEFAIVAAGGILKAEALGEIIARDIEAMNIPFADGRVTVSVGVVAVSEPGGFRERLDAALDEARRAGGNCVRTAAPR